jgi:hypothetical protein
MKSWETIEWPNIEPEGKRPLGRPRRRWVDNIKMDLGEVGWGDVDWIGLAKDMDQWRTLVNTVINLQVPYNFRKFSSGFSRRARCQWVTGL